MRYVTLLALLFVFGFLSTETTNAQQPAVVTVVPLYNTSDSHKEGIVGLMKLYGLESVEGSLSECGLYFLWTTGDVPEWAGRIVLFTEVHGNPMTIHYLPERFTLKVREELDAPTLLLHGDQGPYLLTVSEETLSESSCLSKIPNRSF